MLYLYCRKRTHRDFHFIEFFLPCVNGSLVLPSERLARFHGRSCAADDTTGPIMYGPLMNLSTNRPAYLGSQTFVMTIVPIGSSSSGVVKKERSEILANGTWLTYHDVVPKGGPIGPSASVYYGVPIHPDIYRVMYHGMAAVHHSCYKAWPVTFTDPFVVYHGTSRESIRSILTSGLRPTDGMLGHAIYFGSFWKSFRFATMTQDYKKRSGAIFRCYAFWKTPYFKTLKSGPCTCGTCDNLFGVDHNGSWKKLSEAVFLLPEAGSSVKNEEYACSSIEKVLLDTVAYAESQTEHHEPLNRSLQIL